MKEKALIVHEVSNQELHLFLKSKDKLIQVVRSKLKEFARQKGFSDEEITDIQIAVNEALANIIKHAYHGKERGRIEINVSTDSTGDLVISIRDYGQKANPKDFKSRDLEELKENGLGIYLIYNLMDEVEFDPSPRVGTKLKLKKNRAPGKSL